jgi:murein DD-endopeptidase MepM/ murein hydrolase activator NlpD
MRKNFLKRKNGNTNYGILDKLFRRFKNIILLSSILVFVTEFILIGTIILFMMFFGSYVVEQEEIRYFGENEKLAFQEDIVYKGEDGELYYKCAFPIANAYNMSYADGYGDGRSYGSGGTTVSRKHEGIDIMCDEGSPIIAVEGGVVLNIGWNQYGGWRMSILNEENKRTWYYAHMRKEHPYVKTIEKGQEIEAGQVIGYVGATGYGDILPYNTLPEEVEDPDNISDGNFAPHLHIGIYDETGGSNPQNPYPFLQMLEGNKISVKKINDEYVAIRPENKLKLREGILYH